MGQFRKAYTAGRAKGGGFDRNSRGSGGRGAGFGGRDRGGDRGDRGDRGAKQMFAATCGDCGKDCEVPFRPTGKHPVFCSSCFRNQEGGDSRARAPQRDFNKGGRDSRDSYDRKPRRPEYSAPHVTVQGITKEQFASLEKKVDSILSFLHTQRRDGTVTKESVSETKDHKTPIIKTVKKVVKAVVTKDTKKASTKKVSVKKAKVAKKKK